MYIPSNYTKQQVIDIIVGVSKRLSNIYKFGYLSSEDIEQECFLIVLKNDCQCLKQYDQNKPLENFLYTHIKNRIYNFKRDNFTKPDSPCKNCPLGAFIKPDQCSLYEDKLECSLYDRWKKNNDKIKNIMNTITIENVDHTNESNMSYSISNKEDYLSEGIIEKLSVKSRKSYVIHMNNGNLKKKDFESMVEEIKGIINNES